MIIISCNCRGLGRRNKEVTLRDLIRTKNPTILLLQETKMEASVTFKICKKQLWFCEGLVTNSRGSSRVLFSLWNKHNLHLNLNYKSQHWILTIFTHH